MQTANVNDGIYFIDDGKVLGAQKASADQFGIESQWIYGIRREVHAGADGLTWKRVPLRLVCSALSVPHVCNVIQ